VLTVVLIVSAALVIVALMGAVAYGGPKTYWYYGQLKLLTKSQQAADKMMDVHIADHTTDVEEVTLGLNPTTGIGDGQYL
jgi:hypothetical protein